MTSPFRSTYTATFPAARRRSSAACSAEATLVRLICRTTSPSREADPALQIALDRHDEGPRFVTEISFGSYLQGDGDELHLLEGRHPIG